MVLASDHLEGVCLIERQKPLSYEARRMEEKMDKEDLNAKMQGMRLEEIIEKEVAAEKEEESAKGIYDFEFSDYSDEDCYEEQTNDMIPERKHKEDPDYSEEEEEEEEEEEDGLRAVYQRELYGKK